MEKGKVVASLVLFVLSLSLASGLSVERNISGRTVTYNAVNTPDGKWSVLFEDDITTGCSFPDGSQTYKGFMLTGTDSISVNITGNESCNLDGIYQTSDMNSSEPIGGDSVVDCSCRDNECGTWTICGVERDCGSCSSDETCSGGQCQISDGGDGGGGGDEECTDTCQSKGYECGSWTICGEDTNCGSCGEGQTCDGGDCINISCQDECTSGEIEYRCSNSSTVESRECGSDYNDDTCTEWSDWSYSNDCSSGEECQNGSCEKTCSKTCESEGYECGTVCNQSCGSCQEGFLCDAGQCVDEEECTETCSSKGWSCGTVCGENCGSCPSDQSCNSGVCSTIVSQTGSGGGVGGGGGARGLIPENCTPEWTDCTDWSECQASYTLQEVAGGKNKFEGKQTRECKDATDCATGSRMEEKSCEMKVPVTAKKVKWCDKEYIEIRNRQTDELVSRVRKSQVGERSKIDIGFVMGNFSGYCDYCYNSIQDKDETGVDCGGPNCPECIEKEEGFDWEKWLVFILGLLLIILVLSYIIYHYYRVRQGRADTLFKKIEEMKEKRETKQQEKYG